MSSGTITVSTQSVDYGGGRGARTLTNVIGWLVDNTGKISFSSISSTDNVGGNWGVCTTGSGRLYLEAQVSYDNGSTWQTVTSSDMARAVCPSLTNAVSASITLIGQLDTPTLSGDCLLRILYYADGTPSPSPDLPYAFPNSSYSAATQVPVHIDVSWTATIKYNANGGSGAPSDTTGTSTNNTQTLTISATEPTRTNYRFTGWATSSSATTAQYQPGDSITINKNSPTVNLYAVWDGYYRPGTTFSTIWQSNNKTDGACHILSDVDNVTWTEMRTIGGDIDAQGTPPLILHAEDADSWYNQKKLGKES